MKQLFKFKLSRHHSVEIPDFSTNCFIENETELYPSVVQFVKEAIEADIYTLIPSPTWNEMNEKLYSFFNEEISLIHSVFVVTHEDEEDIEVLLYCERNQNGQLNMFYNTGGEIDKYENTWFSFSIVDDEIVQQKKNELLNKSAEELIELILLDTL